MRVTPVAPIVSLSFAKPYTAPHSPSPKIWCSQCRGYKPRAGHIKVSIDKSHYRVVCEDCAKRNAFKGVSP